MDSAKRCRVQSSKCRRLVPFAKSEAEATVLKSLSRSWAMIANQTDRYDKIKESAAQNKTASIVSLTATQERLTTQERLKTPEAWPSVQSLAGLGHLQNSQQAVPVRSVSRRSTI